MAAPRAILAVLAVITPVQAVVPPGYVLDITPECGTNGISDGAVHLMTDFDAEAKAICAGNKEVSFTTHDGVFFNLPVSYPHSGSSPCKFVKKKDAFVYTILVMVAFGSPGSRLHQSDERYTITCSFQPGGKKKSSPLKIKPGDTAPRVLEGNTPPESTSVINLYLVNILGKKIIGSASAGKSVRLKAVTFGPADKGIRPESCDAVNSKGARFSILRSGCGDGMVMKQTKGFRTYGKVAYSPFFKLFTINGDPQLSIDCNFTICAKACNGPSCSFEWRRRRELPGNGAGSFHRSSVSFARTEMVTLYGVSTDVLSHPEAHRSRVWRNQ
ncbi:vitelline envelope sperm lysin receptor-like [Haliotis asinina]|uniref:vitelline envelope sperm lysin receptor-like n=1 Tax=Haliotis asinina TaxID=109174 RepID=UPI00353268D8